MSEFTILRRSVAIVGVATDAETGAPLAGALAQLGGGPPEFSQRVALLRSLDPRWEGRRERLDRAYSRPDGRYFFTDLPAGVYTLTVSAPQFASRYGSLTLNSVEVFSTREPSGKIKLSPADAALPPTCIVGRVTRSGNQPVVGATVRLRADPAAAQTDEQGRYLLSRLVAGAMVLEITARGFALFSQAVTLTAGQKRTVDATLTAVP